jgi:hypothetical protein
VVPFGDVDCEYLFTSTYGSFIIKATHMLSYDEHNNTHCQIGESIAIMTKQGATLCNRLQKIEYEQCNVFLRSKPIESK